MTAAAPFAIRSYRVGDEGQMALIYFDAVRALGSRAYSPAQVAAWAPAVPDPGRFAARASDGRTTLVAVELPDGPLIAFGDVERDGHIDFLYCRPDMAGKGIAPALLDAVLDAGRAMGVESFYVEASEVARPLFERKGFEIEARRDFTLNDTAIYNYRMTRAA